MGNSCCRSVALMVLIGASVSAPSALAQRGFHLEVAAGGGFAGIREAEVQTEPNLTCDAGTGICTPDTLTTILIRNKKYSWRPSLSTGVIVRYQIADTADGAGIGIGAGGHFVFVPNGDGSRAAPAITLHVGSRSTQLFAGFIFVPTDEVHLPGGGNRAVVPRATRPEDFIRRDAGEGPSFFAGVVIGGISVSKPS